MFALAGLGAQQNFIFSSLLLRLVTHAHSMVYGNPGRAEAAQEKKKKKKKLSGAQLGKSTNNLAPICDAEAAVRHKDVSNMLTLILGLLNTSHGFVFAFTTCRISKNQRPCSEFH